MVVLYWIAMVVLTPLYGGLLGLDILLVPLLWAMAWSIGASSHLATTWTCPQCHSEMHRPEPVAEPRRERGRRHGHVLQPT